jgi:hypothetical protein
MDEEVVPVLRVEDAGRAVAWYERLLVVDEEGLAGREVALTDPDGNRLRIATRRR